LPAGTERAFFAKKESVVLFSFAPKEAANKSEKHFQYVCNPRTALQS
jgi:hypothetical protein